MVAAFRTARKPLARIFLFMSAMWLAACDPAALATTANTGQDIDPNGPVQVALLVPGGSGSSSDAFLAQNLENAARLAIADLNGPDIRLRVYNTAGADPSVAASTARAAVDDGAKIILGPLFAQAANAAGVAVADRNVNVLSFSNSTAIAGGNVMILGATFDNTASRLVQYASRQGINRFTIAHANETAGIAGRDAIANAVARNGGQVTAVEPYPLTQQGIQSSAGRIVSSAKGTGSDAIFSTAIVNADLPILATSLPDNGWDRNAIKLIGLTRWDAVPQAASLPGLQGGLFALPDQTSSRLFASRYAAAYGAQPHPLAGLAYDGIAAIGALIASGDRKALTKRSLTARQGFKGTSGAFRLLPNGQNQRALAVASIRNNQVVILEQAPKSFGGAGF